MLDFIDDVNRCNASWHVARLPPEAACDIAALAKSGKALSEFEWLSANIPAQIHDVLLAHGNIRHPFEIGAARECTWISESDWLYRLEFPHGSDVNTTHYFLHFEGLDTIVDVYLNGEHIAEHRD